MARTGPGRSIAATLALTVALLAFASPAQAAAGSDEQDARELLSRSQGNKAAGKAKRRAAAARRRGRNGKHRRRAARRRLARLRQRRRADVGHQVALSVRPRAESAENAEILFRGDFEAGFEGWHVQSLSSRVSLLSGGTFQGSAAARFEVQEGDVEPETGSQRSEVSGPTFNEGQDLYFRDALRIPQASSYDGPWQIVQQLHEEDWGGSPGIAVFLESDDRLRIGRGDGDETYWESQPLLRDRWHDLVYRVHLSQNSSSGFVEVWLNGVQQTLENGDTRAYGETIQTSQTYLKAGIYRSRSSTGTSLVEHDSIVVGTSLAAVATG